MNGWSCSATPDRITGGAERRPRPTGRRSSRAVYARDTSVSPRTRTTYPCVVMTSVLVLGAGFGGLELSTRLSEELGDQVDDHADRPGRRLRLRFLEARRDVRQATPEAVGSTTATSQAARAVPSGDGHGDRSRRRRVTTDLETLRGRRPGRRPGRRLRPRRRRPGLVEAGNEFYSVAGAESVRDVLPSFERGRGDRRRVRRAVQVPARAERGGDAAAMNTCASAACAMTSR